MVGRPVLWEELTWQEVRDVTEKVRMVMVPFGATEQHGPHLPLCVDTVHAYEIAKMVSTRTGVPVVPPVAYGHSASHEGFPGVISLRPETLSAMAEEICDWLYRSGIRKFLLLNGHIGNIHPLLTVRDSLRLKYPDVQVRVISWWDASPEVYGKASSDSAFARAAVAHSGRAETSNMLVLRPDLVKMERAVDEPKDPLRLFWEYPLKRYTTSGVAGRNATGATRNFGEELLEQVVESLSRQVVEALKESPPYG